MKVMKAKFRPKCNTNKRSLNSFDIENQILKGLKLMLVSSFSSLSHREVNTRTSNPCSKQLSAKAALHA